MPTPCRVFLLVTLAACASCDRLTGSRGADGPAAQPAPAPAPPAPPPPLPQPPPAPSGAAPAPTPAPGGQPATSQTIELPGGLGTITLNVPPGAPTPTGGPIWPATPTGEARAPTVPPAPPPPEAVTSSGSLSPSFQQTEARAIHAALLAALPEAQRARVAPVPLDIVPDQVEPNAAAACTRGTRQPAMLITTAMLTLAAGIAETTAYDELAGTRTHDEYARLLVGQLRSRQPITGVPPGLHPGPQARDPRKLARELQLFQEQVAFILAHELAHHHRGHTGCVGSGVPGRADAEELARLASSAVPPFTQPLEVEADTWAVHTVLEAGNGRPSGTWTEGGALLNLEFFGRLRDLGGAEILSVFLSTHPLPQIRRPIVQMAASSWAPGRWPPGSPDEVGGLPIPGLGTLPIQIPGLTAP